MVGRPPSSLVLCCFVMAVVLSPAQAHADSLLRLVDDRGRGLDAPVEACFQVGLRTDCAQVPPAGIVHTPAAFQGLLIEGERHGPLRLRRDEMKPRMDGSFQATVARKALLRVERADSKIPLTVSLYLPRDETFREPLFRARLAAGESELRAPAGTFVAALTSTGKAPDLQFLMAPPGERARLTYRPRPGWSLVVRCRAAATGQPVDGALVRIASDPGFDRPQERIAGAVSGPDGLVLFSGVAAPIAGLSVRHSSFLPLDQHGLTAGSGTFMLRAPALEIGGLLRAHISIHGRPLPAAICQLLTPAPASANRHQPEKQLWQGATDLLGLPAESDGSGRLVLAGMAAGDYDLFLSPPGSEGAILAGLGWGFLTSVSLPALATTEIQLTVSR
jgi:hypothetical protein